MLAAFMASPSQWFCMRTRGVPRGEAEELSPGPVSPGQPLSTRPADPCPPASGGCGQSRGELGAAQPPGKEGITNIFLFNLYKIGILGL